MKKVICMILVLLLLVGCSPADTSSDQSKQNYITGVWLSYSELDAMLQKDFKAEFDAAVQNCLSRGVTDMFVHIRPHCDSYYPSQLFPTRATAAIYSFDVLEYMINVCHQSGIKFHAWLNPYRVRTADSDISALPDGSPAKQWLSDENADNDTNVSLIGGVYLNPASSSVRALIIDGIREIIDNYDVDGIHFDDYFYPTAEVAFDEQSYSKYCDEAQRPLGLGEWRRANVNALISGVYTAIKFKNKDIVFSISPSASIEENYNKHYADVAAWCDNACVDYIIPQLYFGFDYPDSDFKFDNLLQEWQKKLIDTEVKLLIGLATYKIGTQNEPDRAEWSDGIEVIKKQAQICKDTSGIDGHIYFSYSSMMEHIDS
ncbi:MAG: family 10 glycosylhydrolase [Clostridia bacterium]|nr:family 10 glycosylhydrolase [Clostridia bacterium]